MSSVAAGFLAAPHGACSLQQALTIPLSLHGVSVCGLRSTWPQIYMAGFNLICYSQPVLLTLTCPLV